MTESSSSPTTHKPNSESLLPPRKQEYVYHWDRIIGVILLALLLLGATAYGVHAWLTATPELGTDMAEALPEEAAARLTQQPDLKEDPIQQMGEEDLSVVDAADQIAQARVAEVPDSQLTTQEAMKPLLQEAIIKENDPLPQDAEDRPLQIQPIAPEAQQTGVAELEATAEVAAEPMEPIMEESVTDPQPIEDRPTEDELAQSEIMIPEQVVLDRQAESSTIAESADSPFRLQDVKISESRVKRFLLTRYVAQKEPVGELSDIQFNAYGSAVVWCFSEVVDMAGSQLSYVWLHKGDQVARIPLDVRGDRWRSYSNKIINHTMTGAWRVELVDGMGKLLASIDFTLPD